MSSLVAGVVYRESVSSSYIYTRPRNSRARGSIDLNPAEAHGSSYVPVKRSGDGSPSWAYATVRPSSAGFHKSSSNSLSSSNDNPHQFSHHSSSRQLSLQNSNSALLMPTTIDAADLAAGSSKRLSRAMNIGIEDIQEARESIDDHGQFLSNGENGSLSSLKKQSVASNTAIAATAAATAALVADVVAGTGSKRQSLSVSATGRMSLTNGLHASHVGSYVGSHVGSHIGSHVGSVPASSAMRESLGSNAPRSSKGRTSTGSAVHHDGKPRVTSVKVRSSIGSQYHADMRQSEVEYESQDVVGDTEPLNSNEYYDYLMMSQRHASSNFIHKIDSSEVIWQHEQKQIKMIGSYLLGDQIGKGSFGKVKEGRCSETLQRVAVKIINKKRLKKVQNGLENVINEIKLLKRLKHRNIIKLIDVYCKVEDEQGNIAIFDWFPEIESEPIEWRYDDGTVVEATVSVVKWYLIFEYCPCSLQVLVEQEENGRLSAERSRDFFNQLLEGVQYLHSHGVIHRDIKPGNMLVTQDGLLKIADFGIAEQFSMYNPAPMMISTFAGTHQFIAPEIADGLQASFSGEKVDVWAAGVTLFNLLTGGYPFDTEEEGNLLSLYEKISAATFEMPNYFDPELKNLLSGIFRKDPAERLNVEQILRHPWCTLQSITYWKHASPILSYPENEKDYGNEPAPTPTALRSDIERHPFSFRPHAILSYVLKKNKRDVADGKYSTRITPCETTLIPYLEFLHRTELDIEMVENGTFGSHISDDSHSHKRQSSNGTLGSLLLKLGSKSRVDSKRDLPRMKSSPVDMAAANKQVSTAKI